MHSNDYSVVSPPCDGTRVSSRGAKDRVAYRANLFSINNYVQIPCSTIAWILNVSTVFNVFPPNPNGI